jgi:hypothetical protein
MKLSTRLLAALFVAMLLVGVAGPAAFAFTEAPAEDATEEAQPSSGVTPAEDAPPPADEDEEQPWTARFLAPTVLALGVVATIATVAYYGVRIRGRYEVAE